MADNFHDANRRRWDAGSASWAHHADTRGIWKKCHRGPSLALHPAELKWLCDANTRSKCAAISPDGKPKRGAMAVQTMETVHAASDVHRVVDRNRTARAVHISLISATLNLDQFDGESACRVALLASPTDAQNEAGTKIGRKLFLMNRKALRTRYGCGEHARTKSTCRPSAAARLRATLSCCSEMSTLVTFAPRPDKAKATWLSPPPSTATFLPATQDCRHTLAMTLVLTITVDMEFWNCS